MTYNVYTRHMYTSYILSDLDPEMPATQAHVPLAVAPAPCHSVLPVLPSHALALRESLPPCVHSQHIIVYSQCSKYVFVYQAIIIIRMNNVNFRMLHSLAIRSKRIYPVLCGAVLVPPSRSMQCRAVQCWCLLLKGLTLCSCKDLRLRGCEGVRV